MMQNIQKLSRGQRLLVFIFLFGGGLLLIVAFVVGLILLTVNSSPRAESRAVADGVSVREFAVLPGNDVYPATVEVGADGTVYTASYATGAVWSISPEGDVRELNETRDDVGSAVGIAIAPDNTLYILDRLDSDPRAAGGLIWKRTSDGALTEFGTIEDEQGFVSAHAIVVDGAGNVYMSDRGRREVWRFNADGEGERFWRAPLNDAQINDVIPTGLAYDASTDTLLITDLSTDTIFRVGLETVDDGGENTEIVYRFPADENGAPDFDGITVAPDGTIYVAAFRGDDNNGVIRLDGDTLTYLAINFRGANDVAYFDGRIYVTNFDSQSLVLPGINPQLPFAIDVIELNSE
ncbi:MAG: hypothetical protein RLP44_03970 [Aggregatilineales bacterium]